MAKTTKKNAEQLILQQVAELEKKKSSLSIESIRAAEDSLLVKCLDIVEGSLDFAALGYNDKGELDEDSLPEEWQRLPPAEKAKRIRLARYSCLPSSDVPYGVKAAHATLVGIMKSRAQEKSGKKVFNMEVSLFPAPSPVTQDPKAIDAEFEIVDIE